MSYLVQLFLLKTCFELRNKLFTIFIGNTFTMRYLYILLLLLPISIFAQCPPTGGIFTSQAQIDALAINYPDCTEVGYFLISGDDITDLSGLNQIDSCTYFEISNNLALQSTAGLNPNLYIRYVEGTGTSFTIENNASLLTVDGLENFSSQSGFESEFIIRGNPMLVSVEGAPNNFNPLTWFYIENNDSLVNLNGLENYGAGEYTSISDNDSLIDLTGLDELVGETISISDNENLQSLNGTIYSGFADYLYIENNQILTDISGIYAGDWLVFDLVVRNNPNLSMCSSENVCDFFTSNIEEYQVLRGTFENNAPGCNNVFEVEYGCGINSNDDCLYGYYPTSHITLGETIQVNNEFATTSEQTPLCNDITNRKDVWFAFNSGENTIIDIIVSDGFYLQLWYLGIQGAPFECGNQTIITNGCGSGSLMDFVVNPNTIYLIQAWNDDTTDDRGGSSWFDLTVQEGTLSTSESTFEEFKLYPNPTNGLLNLESNLPIDEVKIYNVLGQQVMSLLANTIEINMSQLKQGMYFVQVEINGKTSTHKVLKQ